MDISFLYLNLKMLKINLMHTIKIQVAFWQVVSHFLLFVVISHTDQMCLN